MSFWTIIIILFVGIPLLLVTTMLLVAILVHFLYPFVKDEMKQKNSTTQTKPDLSDN